MKDMRKPGYFTGWMFDENSTTKSHRIYYNDIDIASGDFLCDGKVVGNINSSDLKMTMIDKKNNYMWYHFSRLAVIAGRDFLCLYSFHQFA